MNDDNKAAVIAIAAIVAVVFFIRSSTYSAFGNISFPAIPDELKLGGIILLVVLGTMAFLYPKN